MSYETPVIMQNVLQLRVYGTPEAMIAVANRIDTLPGARHVGVLEGARGGRALVTADIRTDAADQALSTLRDLGVPADDIVLTRLDIVGSFSDSSDLVVVWADVLGQAHQRARAPIQYVILMAVAGVIAAFGVINQSPVLIVGAMAISPDLLPITAACTGLVLRRPRLFARGILTLAAGLATTAALAAIVALFLRANDLLPTNYNLDEIPVSQTSVGATTIIVAFAAGIAGMLAVETRAGSAIGVAISVTTIPAAAYLGVAIAIGEIDQSSSGFAVLGTNVALMLVGGSLVLAAQRLTSAKSREAASPPAH